MGIRKKQRALRTVMREGVLAALRADGDVLEACKPRTALGRLVRGLVLEAIEGKAASLRVVMSFVNEEETAQEGEEAEDMPDELQWDWSPEGVWRTMPEPAAAKQGPDEVFAGPDKTEMGRRLAALMAAGEQDRAAGIMAKISEAEFGRERPLSSA